MVVLGVGGQQVLAGDLDIGVLAAFLLYLRSLFDPVQQLSELYGNFQSATAGGGRVGTVPGRAAVGPRGPPTPSPSRTRAATSLEDVCFAYDGDQIPARPRPARLEAGATLALIGPTGAGKSTVAKLIARFYDPQGGRVTLDGVDLRQVRLADLRRAMGYVPRRASCSPSFAHGKTTVADNIRCWPPERQDKKVEAAARAIGAEPVILELPDGYDTEVGERGALLSAGQRQLVAFAGPGSPTRPC